MGLFRSASSGAQRETRSERRGREARTASARRNANEARMFQDAERASKERTADFWNDYERRNGAGSVDWT